MWSSRQSRAESLLSLHRSLLTFDVSALEAKLIPGLNHARLEVEVMIDLLFEGNL